MLEIKVNSSFKKFVLEKVQKNASTFMVDSRPEILMENNLIFFQSSDLLRHISRKTYFHSHPEGANIFYTERPGTLEGRDQDPDALLTCYMTLGKSLGLSEPQGPHLQAEGVGLGFH